jgi:hypothetical protein
LFEVDNILAESPAFQIVLEFSCREIELDIVPHWYNRDNHCDFYIFQDGQELGTVICIDINEWEWVASIELRWLAQLIGNEIDWHYM